MSEVKPWEDREIRDRAVAQEPMSTISRVKKRKPNKSIEEMATQTPPRSSLEAQNDKVPSQRTGDKPTVLDDGNAHVMSTVPGHGEEE